VLLARITLVDDVLTSGFVGWRLDCSRYTSQAVKLTSAHAPHLALDASTNWLPSASLKIAAVPQCSVFGGIGNSTPFAESSS
jgi:hypothetical protein